MCVDRYKNGRRVSIATDRVVVRMDVWFSCVHADKSEAGIWT